jgi:O-antigen/teichoic acid export membrane protein
MSPPGTAGARVRAALSPGLPAPSAHVRGDLAAQGVLSTIGIVVQGAVRFLFSVVVGNVFGKVVLGAANSAIALALFMSLLQPSAAAASATKFVARARGAGDVELASAVQTHLVRRTTVAALLLGVVGALVAPFLLDLGPLDAVLTGLLVVTYSGYMFLRGILFGLGLVERATAWDVLSAAAALAALAVVVQTGTSSLVLLPLVFGYGVYVVVNVPFGGGKLADPVLRHEVDRFVRLTLVNSLATGGLLQLSMVVARMADPVGAGAFAAALSLATPAALVSRSLSLVLFPSLSAAYGSGDHVGLRAQVDKASRSLSVISVATFGPLMILSPALIAFFYRRDDYSEAAVLLVPLLLAVLVLNVVIGATNSLLTREYSHARVVMLAGLAGAAVGVLAWLLVVPPLGVLGVALGYLLGSSVMAIVPLVVAWRLDQMGWAWLWVRFTAGTALAVALAIVVQRNDIQAPGQIALAVAMLLAWTLLSYRDVAMTVRLFVRRR